MDESRFAGAFSAVAGEYSRGRPGYPAEAIDRLERDLRLSSGSIVVDLAAGTGKLTHELASRFRRVIAVEPLAEMRAELARALPHVEALAGVAEAIPLHDGYADAVLVAQAFHWFDGERALSEIARVLKGDGGLGLLWNSTPWESREGPWFAALDDLLDRRRVDLSTMRRHSTGLWRRAFERDHRFTPLATATFANPQRQARDEFLAALASRSYIAVLGEADRAALLADVERMLDSRDAPVDGDAVVLPLRTEVFWARLR